MKPFSLKAALEGEAVVTRDGKEVTNIVHFPKAQGPYKVCALVEGFLYCYTATGERTMPLGCSDALDLFMAPTKHEVWINLYGTPNQDDPLDSAAWATQHLSKEDADAFTEKTPRRGNRAYSIIIEE